VKQRSLGDRSPPVGSRSKAPAGSLGTAPESSSSSMNFYQHGSIASHAGIATERCPSVSLSVYPSVCPSHSDTVSKRIKLASFMVSSVMKNAKTLVLANIRFILKFKRGHLERGQFMRLGWDTNWLGV